MIELYLKSEFKDSKIPIYYDHNGNQFILSSLGVNHSILYREINFLEDGILLFYGQTYKESEVVIIEGTDVEIIEGNSSNDGN